jgi:hypothetical protein
MDGTSEVVEWWRLDMTGHILFMILQHLFDGRTCCRKPHPIVGASHVMSMCDIVYGNAGRRIGLRSGASRSYEVVKWKV